LILAGDCAGFIALSGISCPRWRHSSLGAVAMPGALLESALPNALPRSASADERRKRMSFALSTPPAALAAGADLGTGDDAGIRRVLLVCRSLGVGIASAGEDAPARVVADPLLLGYVFGAIAGACGWPGRSACELDAAVDMEKAGLLKLALEEALAGPEHVLDALLGTWHWTAEPSFVLGQELGRADAGDASHASLRRLSLWLNGASRPTPRSAPVEELRTSAGRSALRRRGARGFAALRSRPCRC
jgi:hypothetical protein